MIAKKVTAFAAQGKRQAVKQSRGSRPKTKPDYVMVALHKDAAGICDELRPRLEELTHGKFERPYVIARALQHLKAEMDRAASLTPSESVSQ